MSFEDYDEGEMKFGKPVFEMDPREDFIQYCQVMHKVKFGFPYVPDVKKDKANMRWLKATYRADAGRMLKWVFYHYNGSAKGDQAFSPSWFCKANKYWVDQIRAEMQQYRPEVVATKYSEKIGATSLRGLRNVAAASA